MEEEIFIYKAHIPNPKQRFEADLGILQGFEYLSLLPNERLEVSNSVLLIPIIGGVEVYNDFIGAEQFYLHSGEKPLSLFNPYSENEVLILAILLKKNNEIQSGNIDFKEKNTLISFLQSKFLKVNIGIFEGRKKGEYRLESDKNSLFCLAIRGVFEVQDRLLHPQEALTLQGVAEIDFEALSPDAVLLVVEMIWKILYFTEKHLSLGKNIIMEKITIHYGIQGNGISFGLTHDDYMQLKKEFPKAQPSKGVFVEYDIRSDFKNYRPQLERYVFPALVGMVEDKDLQQFKRIEFVKTPEMKITYVIEQNNYIA